jgi:hypothetical protein
MSPMQRAWLFAGVFTAAALAWGAAPALIGVISK